ncbi:hypothetical protein [Cupriavidus pauculus]|uniref:Uncharacterized protein n=1 Tax=Cupriavidus pauculus TaxID=82633 RepID=A0A2N5C337_9BURK|nr:hypothetical protein [Cupriavidus pauculus]PLP96634.1 hypothetical protein CYJ10_30935 [Cupriavidus pauculus]
MDVGSSLSSWALNPLVKDWFLSPFIGAVMGALFTAFVSSKDSNRSGLPQPPARTIYETRVVYQNSAKSRQGDGGNPELGFAFVVLGAVIYLYAVHAAKIIDAGLHVAYSSAAFSVCFFAFSLWRGRILGYQWAGIFLFSALMAWGSTILLGMAQVRIVPWFADAMTKHGIVGFYLNAVDEHGRSYAITQGFGIACTWLVLLFSIGWAIHYIALVNNFAADGNKLWSGIVRLTKVFSGAFGAGFSIVMLILSYFLIDGTIMNLWLNR